MVASDTWCGCASATGENRLMTIAARTSPRLSDGPWLGAWFNSRNSIPETFWAPRFQPSLALDINAKLT